MDGRFGGPPRDGVRRGSRSSGGGSIGVFALLAGVKDKERGHSKPAFRRRGSLGVSGHVRMSPGRRTDSQTNVIRHCAPISSPVSQSVCPSLWHPPAHVIWSWEPSRQVSGSTKGRNGVWRVRPPCAAGNRPRSVTKEEVHSLHPIQGWQASPPVLGRPRAAVPHRATSYIRLNLRRTALAGDPNRTPHRDVHTPPCRPNASIFPCNSHLLPSFPRRYAFSHRAIGRLCPLSTAHDDLCGLLCDDARHVSYLGRRASLAWLAPIVFLPYDATSPHRPPSHATRLAHAESRTPVTPTRPRA